MARKKKPVLTRKRAVYIWNMRMMHDGYAEHGLEWCQDMGITEEEDMAFNAYVASRIDDLPEEEDE